MVTAVDTTDRCAGCARPLLTLANATGQGNDQGLIPLVGGCAATTWDECGTLPCCGPPFRCRDCPQPDDQAAGGLLW